MSKTAAIPMDKEIQSFQFIFTGQQYIYILFLERPSPQNALLQSNLFEILVHNYHECISGLMMCPLAYYNYLAYHSLLPYSPSTFFDTLNRKGEYGYQRNHKSAPRSFPYTLGVTYLSIVLYFLSKILA